MKFKLNYQFKNPQLLTKALTHRSYLNEHRQEKLASNERLEFLGDAVLELIVSLYLYTKYPDSPEGQLTLLRAKLVQTKTLFLACERLQISPQIRLSKGERESGGEHNPSLLADTFEAIVGAIYQDSDFQSAYDFVLENLLIPSEKLFSEKLPQDFKSKFQEIIQAKGLASPTYTIQSAYGPDHNKMFKTAVFVGKNKYAEGIGRSKQEAEQHAAENALDQVHAQLDQVQSKLD